MSVLPQQLYYAYVIFFCYLINYFEIPQCINFKIIYMQLEIIECCLFFQPSNNKDQSAIIQTKLTCASGLAQLATRKYKVSSMRNHHENMNYNTLITLHKAAFVIVDLIYSIIFMYKP